MADFTRQKSSGRSIAKAVVKVMVKVGFRDNFMVTVVSPHQLKHTILYGRILTLVASNPYKP